MFVGDANFGNIYHFGLNQNRTGLSLDGPLVDKVADKVEELGNIIFGKGFGVITDLQVGPDGYLYSLSMTKTMEEYTEYRQHKALNLDSIMKGLTAVIS